MKLTNKKNEQQWALELIYADKNSAIRLIPTSCLASMAKYDREDVMRAFSKVFDQAYLPMFYAATFKALWCAMEPGETVEACLKRFRESDLDEIPF